MINAVMDGIGRVGFIASRRYEIWQHRRLGPMIDRALACGLAAGALIHELQRERGASALYIGARGAQFAGELRAQRQTSDRRLAEFRAAAAALAGDALLAPLTAACGTAQPSVDAVVTARQRMDAMTLSGPDSFAGYTMAVRLLLGAIRRIGLATEAPALLQALDAYVALLEGKEKAGQERATGSGAFAARHFEPDLLQRFISLAMIQDAHFAVFLAQARPGQVALFEAAQRHPSFAELQRLRRIGYDYHVTGSTGDVAAPHWFAVTTARIDQLKTVEDGLAADLLTQARQSYAAAGDAAPIPWRALPQQREHAHREARAAVERREAEMLRQAETAARDRAAAGEVARLVGRIAAGDLAGRIDEAGKDGVFLDVARQLNRLTDLLQTMIGEIADVTGALAAGNLGHAVNGRYDGVFGRLKDSCNTMAARLGAFSTRLAGSAATVKSAAAEIAAGSVDLARRTESQAAALEQTAATMEQIGAAVKQNADHAGHADRLAAATAQTAAASGDVMRDVVAAMQQIEGSATRIGDIVALINEIAVQTNLLALNASVEAARAGDAGRGFAVVAHEVRALAQRSAGAAKDIRMLIATSHDHVRDGVERVGRAGAALDDMSGQIHDLSVVVAEIAAASREQSVGLEQVGAALGQMDELTQRNGAMVEESSAAAQALSAQADNLSAVIGFFKTTGRAPATYAAAAE